MGLVEYVLLALTSLFVILDPIAVVPAFLGMTPYHSATDRVRMARLACSVAACVLVPCPRSKLPEASCFC